MKTKVILAALALGAAFASSAASAQSVEFRAVEEKNLANGKQTLDPAKAYIFVRFPGRMNGLFFKQPDAGELTEYEAEWREKLAKEIRDFPKDHARWVRDKEFNEKLSRKKTMPPEPVMPTEETFRIEDIELRMRVGFGPQYIYSKGDGEFTYLIEVEPGTYTYYGPIFAAPNGSAAGTCFCMGSIKFDAPAGQVTSLGDLLAMQWMTREQAAATSIDYKGEVFEKPVDYSVPASLAALPARPAELRAAGKMNNYFGVMIGRMPPMPGILEYDRGRVIDPKASAP